MSWCVSLTKPVTSSRSAFLFISFFSFRERSTRSLTVDLLYHFFFKFGRCHRGTLVFPSIPSQSYLVLRTSFVFVQPPAVLFRARSFDQSFIFSRSKGRILVFTLRIRSRTRHWSHNNDNGDWRNFPFSRDFTSPLHHQGIFVREPVL